ncbi:DUF4142 domain-containing protein [Rhabdobacter roseus]
MTWNALLLACMFAAVSCNTSSDNDSKDAAEEQNEATFDDSNMEDDAEFAVAAADGGMMEVQLGELAQSKGSSQAVKDFGKMMADDHGKANTELKALAQQKNITLPTTLSDKSQKMYDDLSKKTGKDFDKDYMSHMVDDHKDDIDKFQKQADNGNDPDLKSWAANKVPTLKQHLEKAQSVRDAVK